MIELFEILNNPIKCGCTSFILYKKKLVHPHLKDPSPSVKPISQSLKFESKFKLCKSLQFNVPRVVSEDPTLSLEDNNIWFPADCLTIEIFPNKCQLEWTQ